MDDWVDRAALLTSELRQIPPLKRKWGPLPLSQALALFESAKEIQPGTRWPRGYVTAPQRDLLEDALADAEMSGLFPPGARVPTDWAAERHESIRAAVDALSERLSLGLRPPPTDLASKVEERKSKSLPQTRYHGTWLGSELRVVRSQTGPDSCATGQTSRGDRSQILATPDVEAEIPVPPVLPTLRQRLTGIERGNLSGMPYASAVIFREQLQRCLPAASVTIHNMTISLRCAREAAAREAILALLDEQSWIVPMDDAVEYPTLCARCDNPVIDQPNYSHVCPPIPEIGCDARAQRVVNGHELGELPPHLPECPYGWRDELAETIR